MNLDASPYDAAIEDLEARIGSLQVTLDSLKELRAQAMGTGPAPMPNVARPGNGVEIPHDAFFQMTVTDAAAKYLGIVKKTKPSAELADALLKGGLKSSSKRFAEMARVMLFRDPRFVRVSGEWGLSEWYPGLKKEKKGRQNRPKIAPNKESMTDVQGPAVHKGGSSASRRKRIMDVLKTDPKKGWTASEVAKRLQDSRAKVATAMWLMTKSEELSKADVGYRIPDAT